jgi:hypothetical protein
MRQSFTTSKFIKTRQTFLLLNISTNFISNIYFSRILSFPPASPKRAFSNQVLHQLLACLRVGSKWPVHPTLLNLITLAMLLL